ncbi:PEP-CTERM sorting domain-containing protein [Aquincola sp. S2]|uniref:PEP-CTERM sorting domain-containing protein n=1 Tax=Pseudaquabacterium terrae TaxID=2732868 RepID=A0ABX2EG12_9BURK|nr:PEP-CTERM sorting domain-containing protein [Aquabacterium terrae]NRF67577.1 PEP-CTERM sorting domain-containing protein [Aquabacterium terrae]
MFHRHTAAACLAAATLSLAGGAHAAAITWTLGPSFGGPLGHQGILTNGTLVEATHLAGVAGQQTVIDPGGLNLTFTSIDSPHFDQFFIDPPNNIGDAGWAHVVSRFEWSLGLDVDAPGFLSGLTVGQTYQLQLFSGRSHANLDARTLSFGDGEGHWSTPIGMAANSFVSVVGTFVADASTQRLLFDDNTNSPTLSAYVLREVAPVSPVPEPGSWALALAGLVAMSVCVRRRP